MTEELLKPDKANNPSLVIIDDEEDILRSLRSLFRHDKYKMHYFTSGLQALKFLENNNVDVIICDMRMPEISGPNILEKSTKLNPTAIRIILSGFEEKQIVLNTIQKGFAQHYIMKPWDDEQLKSIVRESMSFQDELRKKHLLKIMHDFNNLPSPPKLHSKLVNILKSETKSHKLIANEIEKSPALVAKLLRISNSVFYGARKQISNVYEALTFIGTEFVLGIVLGLESFETIKGCGDFLVMKQIELIRERSIVRAHIAREISVLWSKEKKQHEIYVAALLLDIGLILQICSYQEKFNEFHKEYNQNNKPVYSIEKELFQNTHDEIGAALLTFWNFPTDIITAVANHHRYTGDDSLTTIVQLADALVLEKDSLPHDPKIDELIYEWEPKLNDKIQKLENSTSLFV